jgi:hypothetical protein
MCALENAERGRESCVLLTVKREDDRDRRERER